ncbi:MAG TPA: alpha/beta hydrolase [Pontiella sp.]
MNLEVSNSRPTLLIISGWAHGLETIRPLGHTLSDQFDIQLITGAQVLKDQAIPDVDYIIAGSMGGLLSLELLPEASKKLILISSTAKFCTGEGYPCGTPEKIIKRMILQLKKNPRAVLTEFYKNVHFPAPPLTPTPKTDLDSLVKGLEYLLHSDVRKKVPEIKIPVLLMHGENDRIIPPQATEWLHRNLPKSQIKIFRNAGHALPAHQFAEIIADIRSFLSFETGC